MREVFKIAKKIFSKRMSNKTSTNKNEVSYEKPLPEKGGFGYIVFVAVTIIAISCSLPLAAFSIVFGEFLSKLGDETTATSFANGIFNTVLSFTGLVTNVLLNKWSCRNVGLLGALVCSIGCFSLIFIHDLISFIVFFGVFQGFGYGLLLPASLTALNNFFNKKLSFILSLSQALMVACTMLVPPLASFAMNIFGYRGTLIWFGGITLLNIPSSVVLSRISWNYKQIPGDVENNSSNNGSNNDFIKSSQLSVKAKSSIDLTKDSNNSLKPLLKKHNSLRDIASAIPREFKVLHLADRTASIASVNGHVSSDNRGEIEEKSFWKSISTSIDFSLLKNPKYLNISLGLSLSFTADISFIIIVPIILLENGFTNADIALTMTIFFGCDLASRILLSVISAISNINNRYLVLWGSLLSALFRIGFVWYKSFLWKTVTLAILGFLRCFIQTPLPLVISEEYPNQFATAYSLYMVVCGVVTLVFGLLIGVVKSLTNSNVMVCHLLTSCYLICVISWLCEMVLALRKKSEHRSEKPKSIV